MRKRNLRALLLMMADEKCHRMELVARISTAVDITHFFLKTISIPKIDSIGYDIYIIVRLNVYFIWTTELLNGMKTVGLHGNKGRGMGVWGREVQCSILTRAECSWSSLLLIELILRTLY